MSVIKGVKVGTTNITGTYSDSSIQSDSKELEITSILLDSIDIPSDTVYNGTAFEPKPNVYAIIDGTKTKLNENIDFEYSYVNNINSGTATVTATGKGNFSGYKSVTWKIENADINVQKSDLSYIYDGYIHGDTITVSTVGNQSATVNFHFKTGEYVSSYIPSSYNLTECPQITNVSENGVVYYKVTAPNHNDATGSYKLEIKPITVILSWGTLSWMYDGKEHSTTCEVSNLISGDTCTVNLTGNSITNIGSTTVTAVSLSNSNYVLSSTESKTLTIEGGLFTKISGIWTPVKSVYKKISGAWVLQDTMTSLDTNEKYVKKELK